MGLGILGKFVRAAIKSYIDSLPDASAGWENESQLEELQVEMFKPVEDWGAPIGGIIAWHKNFPNTPTLPTQFAECNGQVISDSESPYDGQTLPDLNGDGRFLRGGATSGTLATHSTEDLYSRIYYSGTGNGSHRITTPSWTINSGDGFTAGGPSGNVNNGVVIKPLGTGETKPINMSVVWVMRIK